MNKTLRKYGRIYQHFVTNCFAEAMSYRTHFIMLIILDFIFYGSNILTVHIIYNHVDTIGPWTRDNFLFFISFLIATEHLHMTFISMSFWMLSDDIKTGKLDFLLLRPASEFFSIFLRYIRVGTLCNLPWPWVLLLWYGHKSDLSLGAWIALPFLVLFSLTLLTAIEVFISASMFWIVESRGVNFLRLHLQTLARWPDFVYQHYFRKVFTFVIPVLLIASPSVHILLDLSTWKLFVAALISLLLIMIGIRISWQHAFKRYESASS